jgi:hypothetical protein
MLQSAFAMSTVANKSVSGQSVGTARSSNTTASVGTPGVRTQSNGPVTQLGQAGSVQTPAVGQARGISATPNTHTPSAAPQTQTLPAAQAFTQPTTQPATQPCNQPTATHSPAAQRTTTP